MVAAKHVHIWKPTTCECNIIQKRGKNLEIRVSLIIQLGPKASDCPYKDTEKRRRPCEDGGRDLSYTVTGPGMPGARSWRRQGNSLP